MAWTTPKDWEDNELVTAQKLNEQVRDNLNHLYPPSAVRVYDNSDTSINNAAWTMLSFSNERFDLEDLHESGAHLKCKIAGKYLIFAHVTFAANGTGYRQLAIRCNGTYIARQTAPGTGGIDTNLSLATVYDMAVDDYADMCVYQSSGAALNVYHSSQYSPEFGMVRIG
jgi:hypothetical protein